MRCSKSMACSSASVVPLCRAFSYSGAAGAKLLKCRSRAWYNHRWTWAMSRDARTYRRVPGGAYCNVIF